MPRAASVLFGLAAVALASGASPPQGAGEPSSLRTLCANGAALLVEPHPTDKTLVIHLFASSRGVDETKGAGLRHLLEHLSAPGKDETLDTRIESAGGFLRARTLRDAMDYELDLPPDGLELGLGALAEIVATHGWTQAQIDKEAGIIDQELALRADDAKLAAAAWTLAYGPTGADPLGDMAVIRAATPAELEAVRAATFAPSNLTLVISGPIGLDAATAQGRKLLDALTGAPADAHVERVPIGKPARIVIAGFGEARAAATPGLADPRCAATLAAALAIATELDDAFVTYTPSTRDGLVVVGMDSAVGKLGRYIDALGAGDADRLYARGISLARRWARRQVDDPGRAAYTRGLILAESRSARFREFDAALAKVDRRLFAEAIDAFKESRAATVVGQE